MEEIYQKLENMGTKEAREFIMSLPLDKRIEVVTYIAFRKNLLISDIMNSLGIWKLG